MVSSQPEPSPDSLAMVPNSEGAPTTTPIDRRTTAEPEAEEASLRQELHQRNQMIDALRHELATLHQYERDLKALATYLDRAEVTSETAQELKAHLARRAQRLTWLEQHAAQQADGIAWLRQEVDHRDSRLAEIYQSRLWQVGHLYWQTRQPAAQAAHFVRRRSEALALTVGRRILPDPVKVGLKRLWTPPIAQLPTSTDAVDINKHSIPRPTTFDVICFSIIDWEFRWQRPQQLMSQFASHGHRVFFLSVSRFLPAGSRRYEAIPLRDNVWEIRLALPHTFDVYSGTLGAEVTRWIVDDLQAMRDDFHIGGAIALIQMATWAEAAYGARQSFGWRLVYDCMDEWNTFPGIRPALLDAEKHLVSEVDLLVVSGQRLWEKWSAHNANTVLARNGADFAHFNNAPANDLLADVPRPIVGYFGAIAPWFDLELMLRLARERPSYTFVLLGGVFEVSTTDLEALPNVRLLGQQPYAQMPAYLQHFDACIIPFKVNAVTEATDPVKFYEYISQGKPVVAPQMPELYPYREHLFIASSHTDFIAKVDQAVQENDPARSASRIELARQNTWQARLAQIQVGICRAHPRISIAIVSYNSQHDLGACLESLERNTLYPSFEVILVDNASLDNSLELARSYADRYPWLTVIANEHNAGFAGANNQALATASGDYFVLLNPDTVVSNGWLPKLLRHLEAPTIGLVVAVTNFAGNEAKIDVTYTDLAGMEDFAETYTRQHARKVFDIHSAAMYCVGMRRDTFERVGPLDDQFTIGMFEDDDYSHRTRLAGLRVVCAEDVFVHHVGQASFKQLSPSEYQEVWDRNQRRYEQKWQMAWVAHQPRRRGDGD